MLDKEDVEWQKKFGESYIDYKPGYSILDDDHMDEMESEFLADEDNPDSPRSTYGTLETVDGSSEDTSES